MEEACWSRFSKRRGRRRRQNRRRSERRGRRRGRRRKLYRQQLLQIRLEFHKQSETKFSKSRQKNCNARKLLRESLEPAQRFLDRIVLFYRENRTSWVHLIIVSEFSVITTHGVFVLMPRVFPVFNIDNCCFSLFRSFATAKSYATVAVNAVRTYREIYRLINSSLEAVNTANKTATDILNTVRTFFI